MPTLIQDHIWACVGEKKRDKDTGRSRKANMLYRFVADISFE